jgi:hypothetical protein
LFSGKILPVEILLVKIHRVGMNGTIQETRVSSESNDRHLNRQLDVGIFLYFQGVFVLLRYQNKLNEMKLTAILARLAFTKL